VTGLPPSHATDRVRFVGEPVAVVVAADRYLAESSAVVAARVEAARCRAARRLAGTPWRLNAEIPGSKLRRTFPPAAGALVPLERAMDLGEISARGVHRVIRVAWTLSDLAGIDRPTADQTSHALALWLGVPACGQRQQRDPARPAVQ